MEELVRPFTQDPHRSSILVTTAALRNIMADPFLMLTQLAQYWRYLELQVARARERQQPW